MRVAECCLHVRWSVASVSECWHSWHAWHLHHGRPSEAAVTSVHSPVSTLSQPQTIITQSILFSWNNFWSTDQIWLHDSRALIQLLLCDRPINFNQRLPLPFWQLTQATKLTPVTSNFMAIKFSSILDKDKWTFVSRIVFQNIFHWASVYIMEGRIYGQFVCF